MRTGSKGNRQGRPTVDQLERLLVGMCNTTESLFADAVVAFLDGSSEMTKELRAEDYRAHERRLEIDQLALDLLTTAAPDPQQTAFIGAAMKIAGGLKRTADESLRIGERLRSCQLENLARADSLPQMIELTQTMLSDAVEALLSQGSAEEASPAGEGPALHLVLRELATLAENGQRQLGESIQKGHLPPHAGVALVGVVEGLCRIGDEVLGISNQIAHVYRSNAAG